MRILRREGYPTASRLGPGEADRRALDICGLAQARRRLTASGSTGSRAGPQGGPRWRRPPV